MNRKPYLQCKGDYWQKQRMCALVRDNFTCQFSKLGLAETEGCNHQNPENRLRFLHVHHIDERQNGGPHDLSNLITICRAHHAIIHPFMAFDLAASDKVLDSPYDREL